MTIVVRTESSSSPPLGSKPLLPEGPIVVPGNVNDEEDEFGIPLVGLGVPVDGVPVVEFPVDGVPVVEFPVVGVSVELQKSYSMSTLQSL